MNILQKRIIQLVLPALVDWALSHITPKNIYLLKQKIYESGTKVTNKIPGTLDDKIWEYTAGLVLFEGMFKEQELKFVDWIDKYADTVHDDTFRGILKAAAKRLRDVLMEMNDASKVPEITMQSENNAQ